MKNTKKLLALLLTLAMLTALLAGCGSDDSKKLIGSWVGTLSLADAGEDLDGDLAELQEMMDISKLQVDMSLVLREDGTYSMSITPESAEIAIDVMIAEMKPYLEKMIEDQLAAEGINMTLDEFFEASGYTLDDLIEESLDRDEVINSMTEGSAREGQYKASDGKLYFSDSVSQEPSKTEYEPYSFEGETLLLTENMGGKTVTLHLNRVK